MFSRKMVVLIGLIIELMEYLRFYSSDVYKRNNTPTKPIPLYSKDE